MGGNEADHHQVVDQHQHHPGPQVTVGQGMSAEPRVITRWLAVQPSPAGHTLVTLVSRSVSRSALSGRQSILLHYEHRWSRVCPATSCPSAAAAARRPQIARRAAARNTGVGTPPPTSPRTAYPAASAHTAYPAASALPGAVDKAANCPTP